MFWSNTKIINQIKSFYYIFIPIYLISISFINIEKNIYNEHIGKLIGILIRNDLKTNIKQLKYSIFKSRKLFINNDEYKKEYIHCINRLN